MPGPLRYARFTRHAIQRLRERFDAEPADVADLLIGHTPRHIHTRHTRERRQYAIMHPGTITFVLRPPEDAADVWTVITVLEAGRDADIKNRHFDPNWLRDHITNA